jgi:hypothetical protein
MPEASTPSLLIIKCDNVIHALITKHATKTNPIHYMTNPLRKRNHHGTNRLTLPTTLRRGPVYAPLDNPCIDTVTVSSTENPPFVLKVQKVSVVRVPSVNVVYARLGKQ